MAVKDDPAQLLIDACLARGIREYVVCPGARNAPLVLGLLQGEGVRVWNHFEERSAGFFALGRSMESGRACAVVTTSGTAAAELLPSMVEAHYQRRPLVVVTADRPERFRGSGAPQAIEQVGMFGVYAGGSVDLGTREGRRDPFEGWSGHGPWHVNVCLEEEHRIPSVKFREAGEAPRLPRPKVPALVEFLGEGIFEGLVVLLGGLEPEEQEETFHFLRDLGAPVLADATSGLREALGNLALADGDRVLKELLPGKVLRLGDVPVGRFWRDLENLPDLRVCSVTRTGFSGLARTSEVITGRVDDAIRGMGPVPAVGDVLGHLSISAKRRGTLEELLLRYPDSEAGMVRLLSTYASLGASHYLGNSQPIREWNLAAQWDVPTVCVRANRGANGIDGQVSTWLGATAGHDAAWGVFGDLTVLYDLAAPGLLEKMEGLGRVLVVINNGGGRIFGRLPRMKGLESREADVIASAHGRNFGDWAKMWGMDYQRVESADGFDFEPREAAVVLELCPDARQTTQFWKDYEALV